MSPWHFRNNHDNSYYKIMMKVMLIRIIIMVANEIKIMMIISVMIIIIIK